MTTPLGETFDNAVECLAEHPEYDNQQLFECISDHAAPGVDVYERNDDRELVFIDWNTPDHYGNYSTEIFQLPPNNNGHVDTPTTDGNCYIIGGIIGILIALIMTKI